MKATPKSCSCNQCKRGKRSKGAHFMMKVEERAARRLIKAALKRGEEVIAPAHCGAYMD